MEITKRSTKKTKVAGQTIHMYTIVQGQGKKKTSTTKHMTEDQAKIYKAA